MNSCLDDIWNGYENQVSEHQAQYDKTIDEAAGIRNSLIAQAREEYTAKVDTIEADYSKRLSDAWDTYQDASRAFRGARDSEIDKALSDLGREAAGLGSPSHPATLASLPPSP